MIKPEFWSDEKTGMLLSSDEKCLFIGTWNFADDEGLINGNPVYLKSSIFPYANNISPEQIENILIKLSELEMIFRYKKNKQSYLWIVKFKTHQRIDKPGKPQNPPPSIQNTDYHLTVFRRDNYICHICGEYTDLNDKLNQTGSRCPSIDHLKPKSKGGSDYPSNLKTACISCNKSKGNENTPRTLQEYSENSIDHSKNGIDEVKLNEVKLKEKGGDIKAFSLPSQEIINESSIPKVTSDLNKICDELHETKIFPKAHAFKNTMLKNSKNERSILHTLSRCYLKKTFDKDGGPWAYCIKIINIEDGNFNERDYLKTVPESDPPF